ncbi:ArsI/CadI family heavy metal resistance metalloenzyme [Rapidithrix thailandica]|uniref:ArsI/CadI family heavy metal resistance metalloenzyme n=1 Tax=Rapidithrix thailandica TaxID=413964 RepID=A0AAW9SEB7_9BACT
MNTTSFPRMHVSLYVSDLEKTVNFYNLFFGKKADKVKPGYAKYILEAPSLIISFVENAQRVKSSFGHLGLQVATKEEMENRLAKAKEQKIVSLEEMGTACCYAIQDKFWVNDPDGHQWEVYYFHEDAEFNDPKYTQETAEACCTSAQEPSKAKINLAQLSNQEEGAACVPGSGCC